jgi:hypothetical protein
VVTLHLVLLAVSTCSLGAAALRWSCRLATSLAPRILGGVSVAAAMALAESLILGLVSQGTNPLTLTAAAVLTWTASRWLLPDPAPPVRHQVAARWSSYGFAAHAVIGSITCFAAGMAGFQLWRPWIGTDGLRYHAAEPAVWIAAGDPGSFHQTIANFPTQAYPKTMEVLVGWTYSIGRTPLAAVPLTAGFSVLVAAAVVIGLRRLGVTPAVAALAAAAGLLVPLNVREAAGVFTDLPALAWLACSVALSVCSVDEPAAIGLAAVAGGLAIGTKPTAAPFVLVGLAYALWLNRRGLWAHRRVLLAPIGLALGAAGVWYVADWHVYGSPLWPFSRFPSGRPVPPIWRIFGRRFITDPLVSVRSVGWRTFVLYLAGGLVALAAVPLLALASLLPAGRSARRTMLIGGALVVVEVVLWADSEFTGLAHGNVGVVLTGLRYLVPAPLAAAVVLALVTRTKSVLRVPAAGFLLAALGLNLWELHRPGFGFPFRPSALVCLTLLLAGGIAGLLVGHATLFPRALAWRWLAPAVAIGVAVAMTVPASSYVRHYLLVAQRDGFADAPILSFLSQQPGWVHGNSPVAVGNSVYSTLAGPQLSHPLSFIADDESCASIRAAARRGWVILQPLRHQSFRALDYVRAPACMAGIAPAATLGGGVKIYAPPQLLAKPGASATN